MATLIADCNIIIEGCDRVGKSTLIAALECYTKVKLTAPVSRANTYYKYLTFFNRINGWTKQPERPYVFDRGHLSELVYGKLYRVNDYADGILSRWIGSKEAEVIAEVHNHFTVRPTIIIYIEPINESIMLDDERPNSNRDNELAMYERILAKTKLPVLRMTTQTEQGWKPVKQSVFELKELINDCY